jgi:hypothetical protein
VLKIVETSHVIVDVFILMVVVFLVVIFLVIVVDEFFSELKTTLPDGEHGKSRLERDAMLVQKYSEDPPEPMSEVPVAVILAQVSLQIRETTSLLLVPVPLTLI